MFEKKILSLLLFIILLFTLSGLYGADDLLTLGEQDLWRSVNITNLSLIEGKRGFYDVTNSDNSHFPDKDTDLIFSFNDSEMKDRTGNYEIVSPLSLSSMEGNYGGSAALFDGDDPLIIEHMEKALFSPSRLWGDFSLEFRLYPATLKEGSTVFLWKGLQMVDNQLIPQEIRCTITNRRLVWDFENFFLYPDNVINRVSLEGDKLIPGEWTHHILVFDSETGLLEYRINNIPSDSTYTSKNRRESVEFNIPIIGNQQSFPIELGENYTGLIDEFRISRHIVQNPLMRRYTSSGYLESGIIDLKASGSTLLRIDADQHLPGNTSIRYHYALAEEKIDLLGPDLNWLALEPSTAINRQGQFLKVRIRLNAEPAADLAPVLSNITIVYKEADPPHPPINLSVKSEGESIILSWDKSIDPEIDGYMVYYGEEPGVYFTSGSPIDTRGENSIILNGLDLNRRYYFAVTSYRIKESRMESRFSKEISYSP